jgi:hypothetical protein
MFASHQIETIAEHSIAIRHPLDTFLFPLGVF